jgi:hypothetical protein
MNAQPLWDQLWPELIKGVPTALVALIVGLVAAGIALRQYRVARAKLNLDLFEDRYAIFDVITNFLRDHREVANHEFDVAFRESISKAYFLFGPEIGEFMRTAWLNSTALVRARLKLENARGAPRELDAEREVAELESYFVNQSVLLRRRFAPYMDFAEWRGREPWYVRFIEQRRQRRQRRANRGPRA